MARKLPLVLSLAYLGVVIVSLIPILTERESLSGIFAVLLTSPWSQLLGRFLPEDSGSQATGFLLIALGAAINFCLVFFLAKWLVKLVNRG